MRDSDDQMAAFSSVVTEVTSVAELADIQSGKLYAGKIISKVDPHHIIKTIPSRTSQYEARNSPKCSPVRSSTILARTYQAVLE